MTSYFDRRGAELIPRSEGRKDRVSPLVEAKMNMSIVGKYCKGFPLELFRRFPNWTENPENARKIRTEVEGETVELPRALTDSNYLYLQENFTVTDSIFLDENIIFDKVTAEWVEFCIQDLGVKFPTTDPDKLNEG